MTQFDALTTDGMGFAWHRLIDDLLTRGKTRNSRLGKTKEIVGYTLKLEKPEYSWLCNKRRAVSPAYASAELLWYLSGESNIEMLLPYAPQYKNFAENDGTAYGAYGPRIFSFSGDFLQPSQWMNLKTLLERDESSRQAVISIWRNSDLDCAANSNKRDLPCTLTWQFLVRDRELHMVVNMRSNDAWLGTPYDVWCFTAIQKLLAGDLGLYVGTYTHNVGSMHLYEKHFEAAQEALTYLPMESKDGYVEQTTQQIQDALAAERTVRAGEAVVFDSLDQQGSRLLGDAALCCCSQFVSIQDVDLWSPALAFGLYIWRNRHVNRGRYRSGGQDDTMQETTGPA